MQQEALLTQTDRVMRYVSRSLVNCCTTIRTSCMTNPQQIEVQQELEHHARPMLRTIRVQLRRVDRRTALSSTSSVGRAGLRPNWA